MGAYKIKRKNTARGWICLQWRDGDWHSVPPDRWPSGLNPTLTIDQARSVTRNINATPSAREGEAKRERALNRLRAIEDRRSKWLPADVIRDWENSELEHLDSRAKAKQRSIQTYVKEMIVSVDKEPKMWLGFAKLFYDFLAKHPQSEDYYTRVFRSLNNFGYFYAVWRDTPFKDVPLPTGAAKERILAAFRRKPHAVKRSQPLQVEDLPELEKKMSPGGFNWLLAAFWLGLRPEEADLLAEPPGTLWELLPGPAGGLRIYMPKIGRHTADPERAWKFVPIQDGRQAEAILRIVKGPVTRPRRRSRDYKALPPKVRLYGGRHGYVALQKFEWGNQGGATEEEKIRKIGKALGHGDNVATTVRHYYEQGAKRGRR